MRRTLDISKDIVDLGPEMFASADLKVIFYKGDNYYRACGETVIGELPDGGSSTCIKPEGHINWSHEDCHGHTREPDVGVVEIESKLRHSAHRILRLTGLDEDEIFNALNALQYGGFTFSRGE